MGMDRSQTGTPSSACDTTPAGSANTDRRIGGLYETSQERLPNRDSGKSLPALRRVPLGPCTLPGFGAGDRIDGPADKPISDHSRQAGAQNPGTGRRASDALGGRCSISPTVETMHPEPLRSCGGEAADRLASLGSFGLMMGRCSLGIPQKLQPIGSCRPSVFIGRLLQRRMALLSSDHSRRWLDTEHGAAGMRWQAPSAKFAAVVQRQGATFQLHLALAARFLDPLLGVTARRITPWRGPEPTS